MTRPLDLEPILDSWLGEGSDVLPDRSVEAVLRTVERTSQRRAIRVPWRTDPMNANSRLAVVAGATLVLVLVAGGLIYLGGSDGPPVGTQPTPTPSPTASATGSTTPLGLAIVHHDGGFREVRGMPADVWMADLSADGTRVVFTTTNQDIAFCGGCIEGVRRPAIMSVGADGRADGGEFIYPSDPSGEGGPDTGSFGEFAWSPDGRSLAFQADSGNGNLDIYVADLVPQPPIMSATLRRLTTDPAVDEFPAWTPDGSTIVYGNLGAEPADDSGFSPTQELWSVSVAGGTPRRLTTNNVADTQPDVSADGTIAFWSQGTIMAMDGDGTNVRAIAEPVDQPYFSPRWSPDGTTIAALRYDPSERAHLSPSLGLPTDLPLLDAVLIDVATGHAWESSLGSRVASDHNPVSWTPDGNSLLINRYDDSR